MGRPVLEVADIFRDHGAAWRRANAGYVSLPEFWREVQHLSALSLLDFPFLGAAFASSKYSGRRRRGRENPIFPWCARASQGVALRVRIHYEVSTTGRGRRLKSGEIPAHGGQFPVRRSKFPARLNKFPVRRELTVLWRNCHKK